MNVHEKYLALVVGEHESVTSLMKIRILLQPTDLEQSDCSVLLILRQSLPVPENRRWFWGKRGAFPSIMMDEDHS